MRISDWSSDVCSSDLSYSFYRTYCKLYAIEAQCLPLADDYSIRAADYTAKHAVAPAGIIFVNPNAPTGIERKSVVQGKSVSVRVDLGGRRIMKKPNTQEILP